MAGLELHNSDVYFRGQFVPFKEAGLSIASSPVLYGLSVYTVLDVFWDEQQQKHLVFRLNDHYKRLVNSARIMGFSDFSAMCTPENFVSIIKELLTRNEVREDALIRVTIFVDEIMAGTKAKGLQTDWSVFVYPMGDPLANDGLKVGVSSWERTSDNAIPPRAKVTGNYANAALMKDEALANGYDEAIALDHHGHVAESTVANIFLVMNGELITPDQSTDLLEGITRDTVIKLAEDMNIVCRERSVDRSELYIADEIFLSGSSVRMAPVVSVDGHEIHHGKTGPITQKIIGKLDEVQRGRADKYKSWVSAF